jgi:putative transposase
MIDSDHPSLSIARQCQLVSISRSGFYYQPSGESELNLTLMRLIDEQHMRAPYYGARQMARHLRREGYVVGRKRIRRLMQKMGRASSISGRARRCRGSTTRSIHTYCATS